MPSLWHSAGYSARPGVVVVDAGTEYDYAQRPTLVACGGLVRSLQNLKIGVRTVRNFRRCLKGLEAQLGGATAQLTALAHGRDERPVIPDREAKSIGHGRPLVQISPTLRCSAELVRMTDIVTGIRSGVGGAKTWSIKVRLSTSPPDVHTRGRSRCVNLGGDRSARQTLVSADSRSVIKFGVSASGLVRSAAT